VSDVHSHPLERLTMRVSLSPRSDMGRSSAPDLRRNPPAIEAFTHSDGDTLFTRGSASREAARDGPGLGPTPVEPPAMNDRHSSPPPSPPTDAPVTAGEVVKAAEHGRLRGFLKARLEPHAYLGLHLTVGLLVGAAGIWLFGALLDALLDNSTMVKWDVATAAFIHAHMTPGLIRIAFATTQFGGPIAMVALGVVGAIVLWRARRKVMLVGWIAAFAGGGVMDTLLKRVVHRTRPAYGAAFVHAGSYSFPSGHAMGSMIGYGMLLLTLFVFWHPKRVWKILVSLLAGLLVLAIGLSRVLLGVHYPSDVAGGWVAALAWLAVCMTGVNLTVYRHGDAARSGAAAGRAAKTPS
jgi:membrane-associated phospholipid phosphatase